MTPTAATPSTGQIVYLAVVDDNTFYRDWLGHGAGVPAHVHVVARASSPADFVSMLSQLPDRRCDVVVLDLRIVPGTAPDPLYGGVPAPSPVQGRAGIELVLKAAQAAVSDGALAAVPAVLVYTQEPAPRVHVACLLAGACGVVHKSAPLDRLWEAVDVARDGGLCVPDEVAQLIEIVAQQRKLDLTPAEESVLALTAHNWTRRRIARDLGITESTVDKHLRAVRDKFGEQMPLVDVADAFGLRDLAPPATGGPGSAAAGRAASMPRLRELSRRLGRRTSREQEPRD